MQRLPCVSHECFLQDLVLSRSVPGKPKWMCRGFPVSVMNALYKTIFSVSVSYWPHKLCLLEDLNEHRCFPVSVMNGLYKNIFWASLSYWPLSPRRPVQWMCRGFSSVIDTQPFQDHLTAINITSNQMSLSWGKLNNECGELRLPHCHWEMAFSRLPLHQNYHNNSKALSPNETWTMSTGGQAFPMSPRNDLFKTIFSLKKLSYQLKALLPREWFKDLSPTWPDQWMWRAASPASPTNGFSRPSFKYKSTNSMTYITLC